MSIQIAEETTPRAGATTTASAPCVVETAGKSRRSDKPSVKKSSQGPLTMWHGADLKGLRQLASLEPPVSPSRLGRVVSLPVLGAYNSLMKGLESLVYGRRVRSAEVHPEPLFVVGHWRSGTTLLHNLICQDEQFGFPNLYQCVFPHHFLLTEAINAPLTSWMLPKSRPMDNVPCGWDLPQEDEIALCLLSMASPYRMSAMMDEKDKYFRFLDPADMRPDERQALRDAISYFMKKLSVRQMDSDGRAKPLCMKSPTHTMRVAELIDMYPDARFVYIYRNPLDVYNSTVHLRETMWESNGFSAKPMQQSEELMLDIYVKAVEAYERDKGLVPDGQLCEIRYEDLAADPIDELGNAYNVLGLSGFSLLKATLQPQVAKLKSYKKNKFRMDARTRRHVCERLKFAFELYGYEMELDDAAVA